MQDHGTIWSTNRRILFMPLKTATGSEFWCKVTFAPILKFQIRQHKRQIQ